VLGYYALAVGSCVRDDAPGNISCGMPEPIRWSFWRASPWIARSSAAGSGGS
jgi:hypothetical protein